jgi:hypothetical protein
MFRAAQCGSSGSVDRLDVGSTLPLYGATSLPAKRGLLMGRVLHPNPSNRQVHCPVYARETKVRPRLGCCVTYRTHRGGGGGPSTEKTARTAARAKRGAHWLPVDRQLLRAKGLIDSSRRLENADRQEARTDNPRPWTGLTGDRLILWSWKTRSGWKAQDERSPAVQRGIGRGGPV